MSQLNFGVVGPGFIAGAVAKSITHASKARLAAVSSRRLANAEAFVEGFPGAEAVEGYEALLGRDDVDALYIATPTVAKETIALAAIAAGKHVLIDKPLVDKDSVQRMAEAAAAKGVVFMDATHFAHHPRTAAIRAAMPEAIGQPKTLHTTFYFPITDRSNIRYDPTQEPTGALGDMAWYSMRAVVEYLQPEGAVSQAAAAVERDPETGAVVRVSGLIAFRDGKASTFDAGFTAGTAVLDLQLLGDDGIIVMDDFVLDWHNSFAFQNPDVPAGYFTRKGLATRKDLAFIETPSAVPQDVLMIERFADLAGMPEAAARSTFPAATYKTQSYLDALWAAIQDG